MHTDTITPAFYHYNAANKALAMILQESVDEAFDLLTKHSMTVIHNTDESYVAVFAGPHDHRVSTMEVYAGDAKLATCRAIEKVATMLENKAKH